MMVLGRSKLRQVGLIDRYLARSIAVPLIGSLILAAMLLLLDKMLRLFQFVVDAGGPVSVARARHGAIVDNKGSGAESPDWIRSITEITNHVGVLSWITGIETGPRGAI